MVSIAQRRELQDKLNPILYLCYDYILIISDNRVLATHGGSISLISLSLLSSVLMKKISGDLTNSTVNFATYPK